MKYIIIILSFLINLPFANSQADWSQTGPIQFPSNIVGQINGIGRVCQMKFHPTNTQKIYAVSASGGLYVTNNNSNDWSLVGSSANLPTGSCASVCIDPTNDNILYLSTGDPNYYNNTQGVWKTTDAGITWSPITSGIGTRAAIEMIMDPNNHNIIVAATTSGIWRTTNGGTTWTQRKIGGAFRDMKQKPGSNTLYAVTSTEFFRSTDFGVTWVEVTNGVIGSGGMRIAVSPQNSSIVYIVANSDRGTILRSSNSGLSFNTVYLNPNQSLVGYDANSGGQGNYNLSITCNPLNANDIYLVAHCCWRSSDGGVTWTKLTSWAYDLHTDLHDVKFNPHNNQQLFSASDGGVFLSLDNGDNWDPKSDGIGATEIYRAGQSELSRDMVSFGTQDNGRLFMNGNTFYCNRGGDYGPQHEFDFQNANVTYFLHQNGIRKNLVNGTSDQSLNIPVTLDAHNTSIEFHHDEVNKAFVSKQGVWRTNNLSSNPPTWTEVYATTRTVRSMCWAPEDANTLYFVLNNNTIQRSDNAQAASPTFTAISSPANLSYITASKMISIHDDADIVYMSLNAKVYRSADKGVTWVNISSGLPSVNILGMVHDKNSPNESVYVATISGVYYRNSSMSNWQNYSNNLPTICRIKELMIYSDGTPNGVLRVATYGRGLLESALSPVAPVAEFNTSMTDFCQGETIQFTDISAGNPTSWNWSFPGGTPSTSNLQNPVVEYNTSGVHDVTLTASNLYGSDVENVSNLVTVKAIQSLPAFENFDGAFPPNNWSVYNENNDLFEWTKVGNTGHNSPTCARIDLFHAGNPDGAIEEMRTPNYDMTDVTSLTLKFKLAYKMRNASSMDSLRVYVSTDCGVTYTEVYVKGGSSLASVTSYDWYPRWKPTVKDHWKRVSINLNQFVGADRVMVAFQSKGYGGHPIYIDKVRLKANFASQAKQIAGELLDEEELQEFSIYPNPNNGQFTVQLEIEDTPLTLKVYDALGKEVYSRDLKDEEDLLNMDLQGITPGIYSVVLEGSSQVITRKLIVN